MTSLPSLKRALAAVLAVTLFGGVLFVFCIAPQTPPIITVDAGAPKAGAQDWPMFGGSVARNMVNTHAKGLPVKWDIDENKNIKWTADLGSKAYGGPIVAGGQVYIGTNNQKPRNPKDYKLDPESGERRPLDLGVLMAFGEPDGKFLWQATFPKLAARPGRRLAARGALLQPGRRGQPDVLRQQSLRGDLHQRQYRQAALDARHDQEARRVPAQYLRLLAAARRRSPVLHHLQRRR